MLIKMKMKKEMFWYTYERELLSQKYKVIAIDGRCGSGKSTFSQLFKEKYCAEIIKMDDFFLPLEIRTEERLSECGGNIHYERFLKEVINPLKNGEPVRYKRYDCKLQRYAEFVDIKSDRLIVIEGVYSMREEFRDAYDFKIFMDVTKSEQKSRINLRDGSEKYKLFENIWIPKEEEYFEEFAIRDLCDVVVV